MSVEIRLENSSLIPNTRFTARKVRMASEYYVDATVPGRLKYRIGPFKQRTQAREWISLHSTDWLSKNYSQQPSDNRD